jgi:protein-serine/threonine kinase
MGNGVSKDGLLGLPGSALKGVPLDSGIATPAGELADPFEEFNSVTLHHDGEDHGGGHQDHHHDSGGGGSGSGRRR